jgi:hypothetical protein
VFLTVCLVRLYLDHFTVQHHFGFEAAAFYWHFVDVVWLFLYVAVYFWCTFFHLILNVTHTILLTLVYYHLLLPLVL